MTPDLECGFILGAGLGIIGTLVFAGVWRLLVAKADVWRNIKDG